MGDIDIEKLIGALTLEEKISLLAGRDFWHTNGVERLGIPALKVTDGPNGARGDGVMGAGTATAMCVPCGSALGATWNPELIRRVGAALGQEAHSKAAHVLLAPTVNIHRSPLGGRNFECYSEDPFLASRLAVAFVEGVQSERVGTTTKHFVCNDSEFERHTISSEVGERALREIYLPPFEAVVTEASAWGVMAAYNRVNGTHSSEHRRLLNDILRREWGFDGFVVSDWMGTKSTTASANAGLDLEMPGPPVFYGANLAAAVENGEVAPAAIDAMVRRLLTAAVRTDAFADPQLHDEKSIDLAEHREVAREAAIEATVLLKNDDHALPLDPGRLRSIAVIGPNADRAQIAGGGSASVRAHYRITPLDALRERLGDGVEVRYEQGCVTDKILPTMTGRELSTIRGEPGLHLEYFANPDLEGDAVRTELRNDSKLIWFGKVLPDTREFSVRARAAYTASRTGVHRLGMITTGRARLLVDGQLLVDAWSELPARGDAYFGFGSVPVVGEVELREGEPVELVLEYSSRDAVFLYAARLGCQPPLPDDARDRAAQAAAACDAAVVVVGTNDDWESEGHDRESMDLPGAQDELIEKVAAANPRTIVVVNAGSPVSMPWVDRVPAVLDVWFGGQEMANGLAAVLCGDAVPSGKLPTTFPRRLEDTPAFDNYPGKNGKVVYEEDIFVGYRHYDLRRIEPRFPFGHGLSYTTFGYSAPRLSAAQIRPGEELEVEVEVTNEGRRAGSEVVQLYVRHVEPRLERPPRELKAFAKLRLDPGETATAVLRLNERSFAFYDPAKPGWVAEPGKYELHVGSSSRDIRHVAELCLTA